MSHETHSSLHLYEELKKHTSIINDYARKILNEVDVINIKLEEISYQKKVTLPIKLNPENPALFKEKLLKRRQATITEYYNDGSKFDKKWKAEHFSRDSNLKGNLRSRSEYRQGTWQTKGIEYIEVSFRKI